MMTVHSLPLDIFFQNIITSYSIKNVYSHFNYKELMKFTRESTLYSILLLNCQVKQNAQSIPATLGGGQLGYLALVIPPDKYNNIPKSELFIRHNDLGSLTLQISTRL